MRYGTRLFIAIAIVAVSCGFSDRTKQVRTYADMQTIAAKIAQDGDLDAAVRIAVKSVAEGRDAWGNDLVWYVKRTSNGFSYVLISFGSDGRADFVDSSAYFELGPRTVRTDARRDIVFRDGESLTDAGK